MSVLIGKFCNRYIVPSPYNETGDDDYFTSRRSLSSMRHMSSTLAEINSKITQHINLRRETGSRIDGNARTKDERDGIKKNGSRTIYENERTIHPFEYEFVLMCLCKSELESMYGTDFHDYPSDRLDEFKIPQM